MAKHTAREIADYFLASVDPDSGDNLSNLKLQKLVYYAQAFHLAINDGEPLFDDTIEAWANGPVVPSLFHEFKAHESGAIPRPESVDLSRFDAETREILDEVWNVYGQFSAWRLRDMTNEEPPWREARPSRPISQESLRNYFRTLVIDVPA